MLQSIRDESKQLLLYKQVINNEAVFPNNYWHREDSYELFKLFTRYYAYVVNTLNPNQLYSCNRTKFFKDAKLQDAISLLFNGSNTGKAFLYCFDELDLSGFEFIIEGYQYTQEQIKQKFRNLIENKLQLNPSNCFDTVSYKDLAEYNCDFMITYYNLNIDMLFNLAYSDLYPCAKSTRHDRIFICNIESLALALFLVAIDLNKSIESLTLEDLESNKNYWSLMARIKSNDNLKMFKDIITTKLNNKELQYVTVTEDNRKQVSQIIENKLKQLIVWQT